MHFYCIDNFVAFILLKQQAAVYPIIHPSVLCITSSTSEKPFKETSCRNSILQEIITPIRTTIHHFISLNAIPNSSPIGTNIITFIIISGIIIGSVMGSIVTVASGVSIAYTFNFFVSFFIMTHYGFDMSFGKYLSTFWHEVVYFMVLMSLTLLPINIENLLLSFGVKSILIVTIYLVMLVMFGQHKIFLNYLRR